jgi:hypothetical protein
MIITIHLTMAIWATFFLSFSFIYLAHLGNMSKNCKILHKKKPWYKGFGGIFFQNHQKVGTMGFATFRGHVL